MPFILKKDNAVEPYFKLQLHLAQFDFGSAKKKSVMFIELEDDSERRVVLSLDEVKHLRKICEQMEDLFDEDGPNEKGRIRFRREGKL